MGEKKKYIHYGHRSFDRRRFGIIRNRDGWVKPFGGLWGSPVDAEYGWKAWCEDSDFRNCCEKDSFTFSLSEGSKVLYIDSAECLDDLPKTKGELKHTMWVSLDFEKLFVSGYDAIELNMSADHRLYWDLYGWDCDSILVMNPGVIVVEEK